MRFGGARTGALLPREKELAVRPSAVVCHVAFFRRPTHCCCADVRQESTGTDSTDSTRTFASTVIRICWAPAWFMARMPPKRRTPPQPPAGAAGLGLEDDFSSVRGFGLNGANPQPQAPLNLDAALSASYDGQEARDVPHSLPGEDTPRTVQRHKVRVGCPVVVRPQPQPPPPPLSPPAAFPQPSRAPSQLLPIPELRES